MRLGPWARAHCVHSFGSCARAHGARSWPIHLGPFAPRPSGPRAWGQSGEFHLVQVWNFFDWNIIMLITLRAFRIDIDCEHVVTICSTCAYNLYNWNHSYAFPSLGGGGFPQPVVCGSPSSSSETEVLKQKF